MAENYRCQARFAGEYRACWWAQVTVAKSKFSTVAHVGRMSRWPIRLEFPPLWIGAASEGLYLNRNVWNLLHPGLLIPWEKIESANEVTYKDLFRSSSAAAALETAAAQGPTCRLLELKLTDPKLSIVAQSHVFEGARRFLATQSNSGQTGKGHCARKST